MFIIPDLRDRGFEGFVPVSDLEPPRPMQVPAQSGVYAVVRAVEDPPTFLTVSRGGLWKGKDPSVKVDRLKQEWVAAAQTVYLGKAADLQDRIGLLVSFARGEPVMHYGGRLLWQVDGCDAFIVAWRLAEDFASLETELLEEFKAAYGRLPFANLRLTRDP